MPTYACVTCGIPLSAKGDGKCKSCTPFRGCMVTSEDDDIGLLSVAQGVLRSLHTQAREYESGSRSGSKAERDKARAMLRTVSGAIAKMLAETRKIQEDGVKSIELMSIEEQGNLFVNWYTGLPPMSRTELLDRIRDLEDRTGTANPSWGGLGVVQ